MSGLLWGAAVTVICSASTYGFLVTDTIRRADLAFRKLKASLNAGKPSAFVTNEGVLLQLESVIENDGLTVLRCHGLGYPECKVSMFLMKGSIRRVLEQEEILKLTQGDVQS